MPTTTRTDVHRPSVMEPADYTLVGYADDHVEDGYVEWLIEDFYAALGLPVNPEAHHGHKMGQSNDHLPEAEDPAAWATEHGRCAHCGKTGIRYWTYFLHTPSGKLVGVGRDCGMRMGLSSRSELEHREAARDRRIKGAREAWLAADTDRLIAFEFARHMVEIEANYGYEGMRHTFISRVRRYGSVSDKFVRATMRDMARTERREEERAAQAALDKPVIEGRIEILGEVLSSKWQDNDFGGRNVMTVRDDRGFKVWGSVPASLEHAADQIEVDGDYGLKGRRVRFTATITKSDRDETFGFFKRPSKAAFVESDGER